MSAPSTHSSPWSQLGARVKTALILVLGFLTIDILAAFTCVGRWIAFVTALAVVTIAALEVARFSRGYIRAVRILFGLSILTPVVIVGAYLAAQHRCDLTVPAGASLLIGVTGALVGILLAIGVAFAVGRQELERVAGVMRELPLAVFLVGIGGAALVALPLLPGGAWILLWLVLVVSVNDSAAYFIGSRLGGPKLCPAISPNKTWSGSVGGVLCGVAGGVALGSLSTAAGWAESLPLSLGVVVAAQCGDLMKSYLKRLHGVKDSGTILPGHGGVLDRIDGILAGGLVTYIWVVQAW